MKLLMTLINFKDLTPLAENEYDETTFRTDERGYFQTHIYFWNYIPAFSIEDAAGDYSLEFGANKDGTGRQKFQRHSNLYYDNSYKNSLGRNVAGWTYIFILQDGKIIETHKLLILPDRAECEAMIKDLLYIRRELFQKSNENKSSLAENLRDRNWAEILQTLNEQAEEIFQLIKRVNNRRHFGLQKFQEKCTASKIRRFDEKIIRQFVTAPNRKKYSVSVSKKSNDIFENRLLKSKILQLKNFVELQNHQQKINVENLKREINSQIQYIKSVQEKNSDAKILAENTLQSLRAQLQALQINLAVSPNKILEILDKCLALSVFEGVENCNEKWRMTQIFSNDLNYRRAYLKLKSLDEIFDFSFDANEKSFPSAKMFQIYEWWILAKIVEFLVVKLKWQNDGTFAEILRGLFNNLENTKNAKIKLTHENSKMQMEIFYNTEINESLNITGCNLRPDYLFKVKSEGAEKIFILDAKYRNYDKQGADYLKEKDLRGVCFERYIQTIKKYTGKEISMAFIVHSDKTQGKNFLGKYVIYNGANFTNLNGARQQIGAFYFLPNVEKSEINLSLFLKLMFEYFMDKWQICWECGAAKVEIKEIPLSRYSKYYVRCENCGAFWVNNYCDECAKKNERTALIKHAVNYHIEPRRNNNWYVSCPKCGGKL